ncbi:MAG: hypothetical protein WC594_01695 [Thermodesulfovibrionales bacterium]
MKQTLIKILKTIASDVRQVAVPAILLLLVGGSAGLLLLSQKALNFSKQIANTPTPIWATIALVFVVVGYIYLKQNKIIQSSEIPDESPNYKLCYFTIGNYKWEVKVYKKGYFKVNEYPFCVKHDLRFIFGSNRTYCPGTENEQCNNYLSKHDEFTVFEAAKSLIEKEIRNKKC